MAIERDKIDGTQIPTKMPSSLFPVNQSVIDIKKEMNASKIG
jgi:hypothetical protein